MLDFKLYMISDRTLIPDLMKFVSEAGRSGLRAFQLREKDLSGKSLFELAKHIIEVAPDCKLFVNDRADIAMASGANGIHLPGTSWPVSRVRQSFPHLQCGVSVHSLDGALIAGKNGADFIVFGPVYDTPSKRAMGFEPQGLEQLNEVVHAVKIPVFAIGGITPAGAQACIGQGAWGVAVVRDLLVAPNLQERLAQYREVLGSL